MDPDGADDTVIDDEVVERQMLLRRTRFFTDSVMRGLLALLFAFFFLITIVCGFLLVRSDVQTWEQTRQLLDSLVPSITALLGSAVGFYFGTQKAP